MERAFGAKAKATTTAGSLRESKKERQLHIPTEWKDKDKEESNGNGSGRFLQCGKNQGATVEVY